MYLDSVEEPGRMNAGMRGDEEGLHPGRTGRNKRDEGIGWGQG
jgi:hypothetical protein